MYVYRCVSWNFVAVKRRGCACVCRHTSVNKQMSIQSTNLYAPMRSLLSKYRLMLVGNLSHPTGNHAQTTQSRPHSICQCLTSMPTWETIKWFTLNSSDSRCMGRSLCTEPSLHFCPGGLQGLRMLTASFTWICNGVVVDNNQSCCCAKPKRRVAGWNIGSGEKKERKKEERKNQPTHTHIHIRTYMYIHTYVHTGSHTDNHCTTLTLVYARTHVRHVLECGRHIRIYKYGREYYTMDAASKQNTPTRLTNRNTPNLRDCHQRSMQAETHLHRLEEYSQSA